MILALLACNTTTRATIGTDGGDLELPGGGTLSIPPGALSEDVDIEATLITDLDDSGWESLPGFATNTRVAYALTPHGLTFDEPASLSLPHDGWEDGLVVLRADDEWDTEWQAVPGVSQDGGMAVVELTGFSAYTLTVVEDGACPCFDATDVVTYRRVAAEQGWELREYRDDSIFVRSATQMAQAGTQDRAILRARLDRWQGNGKYGTCDATVVGTFWDTVFPNLDPMVRSAANRTTLLRYPLGRPEYAACEALITASMDDDLGAQLELSVSGLETDESVTISAGEDEISVPADEATTTLVPAGAEVDVSVAAVPEGSTCTIAGATGGVLTLSAWSGASHPVAIVCEACDDWEVELPCNGIDDDGDGAVDENRSDLDGDGDGIADECDDEPELGCADGLLTVDVVRSFLGEVEGAECGWDVGVSEDIYAHGAYANHDETTFEVAAVVSDEEGSQWRAALGCATDGEDDYDTCASLGRPGVESVELSTSQEIDACLQVVDQACELGAATPEDPCNGIDDDGDGDIDENQSGDDADGDGIDDDCDDSDDRTCNGGDISMNDILAVFVDLPELADHPYDEYDIGGGRFLNGYLHEATDGTRTYAAVIDDSSGLNVWHLGCDITSGGSCVTSELVKEALDSEATAEECLDLVRAAGE